ncbi:MAG: recombination protein RecR [Planctomycetota bacterium]|nr:MAG: recombination protein RecR [Planctomycetota bacterium]
MIPASLQRLLEELERLPGVGPRTAERLAFHLLKAPAAQVLALAEALRGLKETVRACAVCGTVTDLEVCRICADPARDRALVCVVEQPRDLYAIERLGVFRGTYHVLMGSVALLEGVELGDLQVERLLERVRAGTVREVVLATNPNLEGETTALQLAELLRPYPVQVTRLARGVPAGSLLEYASRATLEDAFAERRPVGER